MLIVKGLGILLVLTWTTATTADDAPVPQGFSLSSLLGTVTVGGAQWQRLDLRPQIRSGAFEAVLDLELFLDETGRFRSLGWNFSSRRQGLESVLRKIGYIQYGDMGHLRRQVYLRVGDLEEVTLAQGMIMWRYRNSLYAPGAKKTGLDLQLRGLGGGRVMVRGIINNFLDLDGGGPVVGGRVVVQPPGPLAVGATVVMDIDQLSGMPDSVRTALDKDCYGAFGVDVAYPLLKAPLAPVTLYGGVSRTLSGTKSGTGLGVPGVKLTMGRVSLRVEYRWVEGRFTPGHFDALYELNRAVVDSAGRVVTREAAMADLSMRGIFGDLVLSLGPLLKAQASYQYLSNKDAADRRLEGRASLKPALLQQFRKVSLAEAYYENHHRGAGKGVLDITSETRFGYRLGLKPVPGLSVIWEVQFTYEPDGTGGLQRRRALNLQSLISL